MLWQSLIEYAEKSRLIEVRIDLNLASIQEAYHASWKRRSSSERREQWRTEVPLFMDNHVVGRITLCGERDVNSLACDTVGRVMETLAMLEGEIAALATKAAHELKDATASQKPTEGGKRAESTVAPIDAETTPKAVASP
jgi:hypothetical protein